MIDAEDHECSCGRTVDSFNRGDDAALNLSLLNDEESYPEGMRSLDPFQRDGFKKTYSKLKEKFRYLRSAFMKGIVKFSKVLDGRQ